MQIPRVVAGVHRQVARFAGPPVTVVVNVMTVVVRGPRRSWFEAVGAGATGIAWLLPGHRHAAARQET